MNEERKTPIFDAVPGWKMWIVRNVLKFKTTSLKDFDISHGTHIADCSIGVYVVDGQEIIKGRITGRNGQAYFATASAVLWSPEDLRLVANALDGYKGKV